MSNKIILPKGFNPNHARSLLPADRQAYIAITVPREKILEFLKANVSLLSSYKLKPVTGFIGSRKESGTIYYSRNPNNENKRELHFVNEINGEWHITVVQTKNQLEILAKNDFLLIHNSSNNRKWVVLQSY